MSARPLPNPALPVAQHHADAGDVERDAAALAGVSAGTVRSQVLDMFRAAVIGLTSWEAWRAYVALYPSRGLYTVAPRLSELERLGWLEKKGRRTPAVGIPSRAVYVLTARARAQLGLPDPGDPWAGVA